MKPTRKYKNFYFSQDVEDAIISYNVSPDERLYSDIIYPALWELAHAVINNYPRKLAENMQENDSDLICDMIAHATKKMGNYKKRSTSNCFSYFNMVVRNYLTQCSKTRCGHLARSISLDSLLETEDGLIDDRRINELLQESASWVNEESSYEDIEKRLKKLHNKYAAFRACIDVLDREGRMTKKQWDLIKYCDDIIINKKAPVVKRIHHTTTKDGRKVYVNRSPIFNNYYGSNLIRGLKTKMKDIFDEDDPAYEAQ